jgi:hypothetical protein
MRTVLIIVINIFYQRKKMTAKFLACIKAME